MDRISLLSDDLLSRIFSLVPTKDAIAMSIQSKRWRFLWKLVPKLEYDDSDYKTDYGRFLRFVDRSLLLHEAPVLENLHLKIGRLCGPVDIATWVSIVIRRHLLELIIHYNYYEEPIRLPRSLYSCETLVVLKLQNAMIVDVPFRICFPSLKTLHLLCMKYPDNESFCRLLCSCPILEDLVVALCSHDNVTTFTVRTPSLQRLSLDRSRKANFHQFEIDAPSLKYFSIVEYNDDDCRNLNIPEVVEARVHDIADGATKLFGRLTSVRRLWLSIEEVEYPTGCILYHLVHLELSTVIAGWNHTIMCLLEHSPKLQVFKLHKAYEYEGPYPQDYFEKLSNVPECLLSHLETFEWSSYTGTQLEKELATYILENSRCLKTATILTKPSIDSEEKLEMIKDLALSSRGSTTCQLVFR